MSGETRAVLSNL